MRRRLDSSRIGDDGSHTLGSSATAGVYVPDRRHVSLVNSTRGVIRPEHSPASYIRGRHLARFHAICDNKCLGRLKNCCSIRRNGAVNTWAPSACRTGSLRSSKMHNRCCVTSADVTKIKNLRRNGRGVRPLQSEALPCAASFFSAIRHVKSRRAHVPRSNTNQRRTGWPHCTREQLPL